MQIGIDSFGAVISDPATGLSLSPVQRMQNLLEEIELGTRSVWMFLASANIIGPSSSIRRPR